MNMNEFLEYSKGRILQTIIELNGKSHPIYAIKLPPFCFTTISAEGITITQAGSLTHMKKKDPLRVINYHDISKVTLSVVKKMISVLSVPGTRVNLDFIIEEKNGYRFHLECEDITVFTELVDQLAKVNVQVEDPFDLQAIFSNKTNEEVYQYLEENLDEMAEKKGIQILRLTQTT